MTNHTKAPARIWIAINHAQNIVGPFPEDDERATQYIRHDLHLAAVAGAYKVAAARAQSVDHHGWTRSELAEMIRSRAPADAIAAREARDRQVREEALREAAAKAEWVSDAGVDDPVGHYRDGYADGAGMAEQAILALIEGETDE